MADPILTPIYQEYTIDMSSNNNFIQVPTIQGDGNYVRYVRVLLIANNAQYIIPEGVGAYIVGVKPDNKNIFNDCQIDEDGRIIVEITSEMTAVPGRGDYQILLLDITTNSQLKSFPFYLVTTKSFNAENITSGDEYQALSKALSKMLKDYTYIMTTCEGYKDTAVEASQNALASEEAASSSETNAKTSEDNAKDSENAAKTSEITAKSSEDAAKASELAALASQNAALTSENNAKGSETRAKSSEDNAKISEDNAKVSEDNAKISETNAKASEVNAKASEDASKLSEDNAKISEDNAKTSELAAAASAESIGNAEEVCTEKANEANDYADLAKKWAEWTDGATEPSATNNARYWAGKAKEWSGFDDIDATSITYTKEDGSKVVLADYLKFLEDLDGETILVL